MRADLRRAIRSALARKRPLSEHPDANLLGAFAENRLGPPERSAVAGHLADCADCRELLALAFGTLESPVSAAAPAQPRRRWSPLWNWAASAAAVCIVVSAVWEYRVQHTAPIAAPPRPPAVRAPEVTVVKPPAPAALIAPKRVTEHARFVPPPPRVAERKQLDAPVLPPPPPSPAPAAAPGVGGEMPAKAEVQAPPPPPYNQQSAAQQGGVAYLVQKDQAEAGAPPAPIQSASAVRMKTGGFGAMRRTVAVPTRWRVASGAVQRSDDGRMWETVPVDELTNFLTVTAAGADVWAGGATGALFHSRDSGAHWDRVATGTTGDIVAIHVEGVGEIVITTAGGRTSRLTGTQR